MAKKKVLARDTLHRCLSEDEITLFMDTANRNGSPYRNLYAFLLNTGLRIGEAAAIMPADIKAGKVNICKTVIRGEDGYMIRNQTKTAADRRTVALNAQARAAIGAEMDSKGIRIDKPVFTTGLHEFVSSHALCSDIEIICNAAGIAKFSPHAFRATFLYGPIVAGMKGR